MFDPVTSAAFHSKVVVMLLPGVVVDSLFMVAPFVRYLLCFAVICVISGLPSSRKGRLCFVALNGSQCHVAVVVR